MTDLKKIPQKALHSLSKIFRKHALLWIAFLFLASLWTDPSAEAQQEIQLPEVVVTTTRLVDVPLELNRIPRQVYVLKDDEIGAAEVNSVPEVIQHLPGITLYQNVGNAYQPSLDLRGFSAEPVTTTTIILDGVRINNPDANGVDFELVPVEDLTRIEVSPGTASIFGKNALAGVVNLGTKRGGKEHEAHTKASGGSFGRQRYRVSVGGPFRGFDYYLGFTQQLEDGFRDDSNADVRRLFAKLGRRFGQDTDITLSYLFAETFTKQAGSLREDLLRQDRSQNQTPGDFADRTLHAATVNVRQRLPGGFSAALNAFVRDLKREVFVVGLASFGDTTTDILASGVTAQGTHEASPLGRRSVLVGGVEFTHSGFDSKGMSEFTGFAPTITNTKTDERVIGLYVQESLDLLPEVFILTLGGRHDNVEIDFTDRQTPSLSRPRTFSRFNPRAGLNWNPTSGLGLYFSYSEGFRTPTVNELFAFFPFSSNPDLDAPKSRTYELGARLRMGRTVEGTLAFFRTDVRDDILFVVTDPTTGGGQNQNAPETRRRGIEMTLKGRYGKLVDGFVNYSFIKATFERAVLLFSGPVSPGNDLPLVPRHRLGAGVNVHPLEGLTFSLTGLYVGNQRLSGDEPNTARLLDAYYFLNGRVTYKKGPLTVFIEGKNLLNSDYEVWGILSGGSRFLMPAEPASVLAGVSLELSRFYNR
ncbi:MAG: TonB-dependent receptor [Nitrospinota bacterium]